MEARWPPNYVQRPSNGTLVKIRGFGTKEACLLLPFSSSRLEADPVPLEEAVWSNQVGCLRLEPLSGGTEEGQG